ncbi:MAG: hypothetical protein NTW14_12650, partial [bacterium]|nr:hypothetical protein [bacterium]
VGLENRFGLFGLRHGGPSCLIKLDVNIRNQEGNSNIKRLTFWDSPFCLGGHGLFHDRINIVSRNGP